MPHTTEKVAHIIWLIVRYSKCFSTEKEPKMENHSSIQVHGVEKLGYSDTNKFVGVYS